MFQVPFYRVCFVVVLVLCVCSLLCVPFFRPLVVSIRHDISVIPPKLKVTSDNSVLFCNAYNISLTCSCIFCLSCRSLLAL